MTVQRTCNSIKDTRSAFVTRHLCEKTKRLHTLDPQQLVELNMMGRRCNQTPAPALPLDRINDVQARAGSGLLSEAKPSLAWCMIKRPCHLPQPQFIFWLIVNHWRPPNCWLESGREEEGHRGRQLKYSSCTRIQVDGLEQRQNKNEESALDPLC